MFRIKTQQKKPAVILPALCGVGRVLNGYSRKNITPCFYGIMELTVTKDPLNRSLCPWVSVLRLRGSFADWWFGLEALVDYWTSRIIRVLSARSGKTQPQSEAGNVSALSPLYPRFMVALSPALGGSGGYTGVRSAIHTHQRRTTQVWELLYTRIREALHRCGNCYTHASEKHYTGVGTAIHRYQRSLTQV